MAFASCGEGWGCGFLMVWSSSWGSCGKVGNCCIFFVSYVNNLFLLTTGEGRYGRPRSVLLAALFFLRKGFGFVVVGLRSRDQNREREVSYFLYA